MFDKIKYDLPAGLVVFLVALPLCLGIALASGAPMFSGIIAGIVGGIVIGSLSGSQVSVSGPAAGLTAIVYTAITELGGAFDVFILAVFIAGGIQLLLGVVRAGIIAHYFPSSVIKGMLAAIGLILILKQLPYAIGYGEAEGKWAIERIIVAIENIAPGAVIISLVSLAILILWERPFLKQYTFFKLFPGALAVVLLGIAINALYHAYFPPLGLLEHELVALPKAGSIKEFSSFLTLPKFDQIGNFQVWQTAITLAIVASLESLLSIEAADKLAQNGHVTPANQELRAQGIGNMISGLIGGLPITAVIVRSSANIQAGGKTKVSAIFHGILLLVCVAFIPGLLNLIPLPSLAVVLIFIGYKLAKISLFREMYRQGWAQFVPFVVTITAILFSDLLMGIGIGMVFAIFYILRDNYRTPYFYHKQDNPSSEVVTLELSEHVSFLNKASVLLTLDELKEGSKVIIDGSRNVQIDHDVKEIIAEFLQKSKERNIQVQTVNLDLNGIEPPKGH
ncbi:MAG: SulP family inorganic anion transporter [Chitinophagales bacterium]|nr:SulP family inorganic anion transporter [Chitinophagales bacterium]